MWRRLLNWARYMTSAVREAECAAAERIAHETATYTGRRRDTENARRGWRAGQAYWFTQFETLIGLHSDDPMVTEALTDALASLRKRMVE